MASITKEMAFDSAPPEAAEAEPMESAEEMPEAKPAAGEAIIGIDVFGDTVPKVGDMLKVASVDTENGTVSVVLPMAKKPGGIAAKAAVMDEMDQVPSGLTA